MCAVTGQTKDSRALRYGSINSGECTDILTSLSSLSDLVGSCGLYRVPEISRPVRHISNSTNKQHPNVYMSPNTKSILICIMSKFVYRVNVAKK